MSARISLHYDPGTYGIISLPFSPSKFIAVGNGGKDRTSIRKVGRMGSDEQQAIARCMNAVWPTKCQSSACSMMTFLAWYTVDWGSDPQTHRTMPLPHPPENDDMPLGGGPGAGDPMVEDVDDENIGCRANGFGSMSINMMKSWILDG